ncbi:MAG TPA: cell division protein FtsX [Firmicutes bacterium]|nr:cell division protein FtsX [Bacillota bacterium]
MKIKTAGYFMKEASTGLSRNGLMSLAAVITISLSLIILGCFYIVVTNFNHFAQMAKGVLELRVYLDDGVDPNPLKAKIVELDGVKSVRYVSREDGAKWLEQSLGVKELFVTSDNPLPDMINIKLKDDAKVKSLVAQVSSLAGVDEVEYGKTFVEAMLVVVRIVWVLGFSLVLIIGIVVLYIITNTIRLTVFARRKEIEIMKLVGATDWFIRWPFMLEGIILGLSGALISAIILSKGYHFLFQYIHQLAPFIPLLGEGIINQKMFMLISLVGLAFGAIGSMMSIKKFLRV